MATPIHGKRYAQLFNSVSICSATAGIDIGQDTAEVTTSCDATKSYLAGKYGWTASADGPADFASSGGDATLFAAATAATAYTHSIEPDGPSVQSSTNPLYTGSAFVSSYSLSFDQANPVSFSASFQGTGALTRAVA